MFSGLTKPLSEKPENAHRGVVVFISKGIDYECFFPIKKPSGLPKGF